MNKTELIAAVADRAGLTKVQASSAIDALQDAITGALVKGDAVKWMGFLTLEVADTPAREGRNPRTGETMKIPAGKTVRAKVSSAIKKQVK